MPTYIGLNPALPFRQLGPNTRQVLHLKHRVAYADGWSGDHGADGDRPEERVDVHAPAFVVHRPSDVCQGRGDGRHLGRPEGGIADDGTPSSLLNRARRRVELGGRVGRNKVVDRHGI